MQRYKLNLKSGTYTEGDAYRLQPIYRQQVVPGQTCNMDAQVSLKTASFTKSVTTPAIMSIWFFYVPHRLVWSEWTDFISKAEGAPTFPTITGSGRYFENANSSQAVSPFYRRAYKLVYNEYFGSESVGQAAGAWFDDVTDDTNTAIQRTRNPEDFASKIQLEGAVVDPEFTVTGSSIPLNDFYRQMMNARSQQRSQMTGDKYVDTLARMGVDATWMIAERPEFLGTKSMMVGPQQVANTSNTNTGQEVARYSAKLKCGFKGKHFAEHGYIIGVASFRPMLIAQNRGCSDALPTGGDWIDSFYSADNLQTKDTVDAELSGFTGTDGLSQRFAYLKNGQWLYGLNSTWTVTSTPADMSELIYPGSVDVPVGDELVDFAYASTGEFSLTGLTPVPNKVA
jgi:hypothetical protein